MVGIEIPPDAVQKTPRGWALNLPIATNGGAMFAVTAPWCGHCAELKKSVAEAQYRRSFDFFFLDGDKAGKLVAQMGIEGYPTIYGVQPGGLLIEYPGARDAQTLANTFYKHRNHY